MANPFTVAPVNLSGLGMIANAYGQKSQQNQMKEDQMMQMEQQKAGASNAMKLLNQANMAQDPAEKENLFMQAYQASPEFTQGLMQNMKMRREAQAKTEMTPYQRETLDLKKEAAILRKGEDETRKLEQQLKQESNELKKQELELKIQEKKANIDKKKKDVSEKALSSIDTVTTTMDTIYRVRNHPGLESATGVGAMFPTLSGSDAAGFESQLETLQSQQFLSAVEQMKGMGSLSESEGKKLAGSVGSLSLDMSDEELKKELDRIYSVLEKAKSKMIGRLPKEAKDQMTIEAKQSTTPQGTETAVQLSPAAAKYLEL